MSILLLVFVAACEADDTAADDPAEDPVDEPADAEDDPDEGEEAAEDTGDAEPLDETLILGHPGHLRPIWASTWFYVTEEFGFWEEQGISVAIRPLRSGGDNVQATHTGEIHAGLTATDAFITAAVEGTNNTGIAGMNDQDWALITTNPDIQSCEDVEGHESGAMAPGDSRYLVLETILDSCGVSIDDVETVDTTGDHVGPVVAGVLDTHVFHIDEIVEVEAQTGEEVRVLEWLSDVEALHYTTIVANNDTLEENREGLVRLLAGLIQGAQFMSAEENHDEVVDFLLEIVEQEDRDDVASILQQYIDMDWWHGLDPQHGLDEAYLEASIDLQHELGNISEPIDVQDMVDTSLWEDAYERVQGNGG